MTPSEMQHEINCQLGHELRQIIHDDLREALREPLNFLTVDRELIQNVAEALQLADRKITSLETIARAVAGALREILELEPMRRFDVGHMLSALDAADEALK